MSIGKITKFEFRIDLKRMAQLECYRNEFLKSKGISLKRKLWKKKHGGGLWDADHIVCVKGGGGQCGLDNIRTLCIECHKKKTYKKL